MARRSYQEELKPWQMLEQLTTKVGQAPSMALVSAVLNDAERYHRQRKHHETSAYLELAKLLVRAVVNDQVKHLQMRSTTLEVDAAELRSAAADLRAAHSQSQAATTESFSKARGYPIPQLAGGLVKSDSAGGELTPARAMYVNGDPDTAIHAAPRARAPGGADDNLEEDPDDDDDQEDPDDYQDDRQGNWVLRSDG